MLNHKPMKKPLNVSTDAEFKYDEWHSRKVSETNKPQGKYTIWDEHGALLHDMLTDQDCNIIHCKSYYPDGSIARDASYDSQSNSTKIIYKSYHESFSGFGIPLRTGDKRYAIKTYQGKIDIDNPDFWSGADDGTSYYNENDELESTFESNNYEVLIEKYKRKNKYANWQQALERLQNYSAALKKQLEIDDFDEVDNLTVSFDKNVTASDFEKAENRLGITFPASYKAFVLENGLIKFGIREHRFGTIEQRMLHPNEILNLDDTMSNCGFKNLDEYVAIKLEDRKKIICFFRDQEDAQYNGWIAFDCSSKEYKECNLIFGIGLEMFDVFDDKIGKSVNQEFTTIDLFINEYVEYLVTNGF